MAKQLTAHSLINYLAKLQTKGVDLKKLVINFREDSDSDVIPVTLVEEDLYDKKTNNTLESIVLKSKP